MTTWRYIKGDEKDFEGAPEWVTMVEKMKWGTKYFLEGRGVDHRFINCDTNEEIITGTDSIEGETIAQRERVTGINDDRLSRDMGLNTKYNKPCKGVTIDVYDVLKAFDVTCPALQHLIKKALAVGQRGHKDKSEDLKDILASARRAIELSEGENK